MATAQDELDDLMRSVAPARPRGLRIEARRPPMVRAAVPPAPGQRDELDDLLDETPALAAAASSRKAPAPDASPRSALSASSAGVDPRLDSFVNDVIGEASRRSGFTYKLGEGVRTPEQQAQKVQQGVSWTMNSRHLHGRGRDVLAFDEKGNYLKDGAHPAYVALGEVYAERAAAAPVPVKWGVVRDGRQVDPGHFELGEVDAIDDLLDALPVAQGDELDQLLADVPEDDEVERVNASPAVAAPAAHKLPPPTGANIYTPEGRAERDAAAASRVRAVTVPLSRSLVDYNDSSELMADAYREGARALNIDPSFVEEWIKSHPGDMQIINTQTGEPHTPADLLGSSAHDERRGTVRLNLGGLADLERDYRAQRSTLARGVDFVTDETMTAGEKALAVAAPVVGAAGRAGDIATRPLQAASTAFWSLARKHAPNEAVRDAWTEFRTGVTPAGAGNYLAEQVRQSETLKGINPNLPGMVGGVVEVLTDPSNLAPLGLLARGGALLRSFKGVRAVEEALLASRNAKAVEFFESGGRILKIEAAPLERIAADAAAAPSAHLVVTLQDPHGNFHRLNTQTGTLEEMADAGLSPALRLERERHAQTIAELETEIKTAESTLQRGVNDAGDDLTPGEIADLQLEVRMATEARDGYEHLIDVIDTHADEVARTRRAAAAPAASPDAEQALPLAASPQTPRERIMKVARDTKDIINLTKAIPASFDNSALAGQGAVIVGARPSLAAGAIGDATRSAMSRGKFERFKRNLVTHPNQDLRESSGLYLASIGKGEETFGSRFAEKIPGVAASQRAYEATLDSLRSNAFDLYSDQLVKAGVTDPKAFKDIARWVNVATGRGELGRLEPLADVLNLPMFSPRLLASKFNVISPVRYARMHPAARKVALTEMFRAAGSLTTTMGLAKLAGADVDLDPFSGGFGTIDADGTSYDLSGGRLRALRFAAQIADSLNRERRGEPVKDERKPRALVEKFFRAYLSPGGALAYDWKTGEDFNGDEFGSKEWKPTAGKFGELDRLMPFAVKEMRDAYHKAGTLGAVKSTPAFVGVGVRTRDKSGDPITPTLSEPIQSELDRLGLDLEHLKDGKQSATVKPRRTVESVTGDQIEPFGGADRNSGMGLLAQETAARLSTELEEVLSETINSPDYEAFEDDEARARYLEMILLNVERRVFNSVRLEARERQMEREKTVKERQDRLEAKSRTRGRIRFKL